MAKDVDVVAARRLHWRSAVRAAVGPRCDMVYLSGGDVEALGYRDDVTALHREASRYDDRYM